MRSIHDIFRNYKRKLFEYILFWCFPVEEGQPHVSIERIAPLYPFSRDQLRYQWLIKVLSLYRLTLGQPRQEELITVLEQELVGQDSKKLFMDLSPYDHQKQTEEQQNNP